MPVAAGAVPPAAFAARREGPIKSILRQSPNCRGSEAMEQATFGAGSRFEDAADPARSPPGEMDRLVPWTRLAKRIEPFHPKPGRGRRPYPLRTMRHVHGVQLFHDLSDPGMADLLYEVEPVRRFAGLRPAGPLPDEASPAAT